MIRYIIQYEFRERADQCEWESKEKAAFKRYDTEL